MSRYLTKRVYSFMLLPFIENFDEGLRGFHSSIGEPVDGNSAY